MREAAQRSLDVRRRVGLLLDRKGSVTHVFTGDARSIEIPDLDAARRGAGRLKGLRWIVTTWHKPEPTRDELNALVRNRFDLLLRVGLDDEGPTYLQEVHLRPPGEDEHVYRVGPARQPHEGRTDFSIFVRELEQAFDAATPDARFAQGRELETALLAAVGTGSRAELDEDLGELSELALGAGLDVKAHVVQRRARLDAKTLIGKGKLTQLSELALTHDAQVVVFNAELAPRQQVALEDSLGLRILDRTQLILDLFAQRARTHAGKLQVECARLRYALPRLVGRGDAMTRIGGGKGAGFGRTKGAGEKKLEIDRRRIREQIAHMERELGQLKTHRGLRRQRRAKNRLPHVALVGYTNVGKSTLFNRLTNAGVLAKDQLFASLDPTLRQRVLPSGRRVVLSDSVGFIRQLPKDLVQAFAATLDELADASLLIHVADASDRRAFERVEAVRRLLASLGHGDPPELLVFNKIDLLEEPELFGPLALSADPEALMISAKEGPLEDLVERIDRVLGEQPPDPSDEAEALGET